LVTGGGGFLGRGIVRRLLQRGWTVRSLHRGDYPELVELGVEQLRGDIADTAAVTKAVDGCDVVFHVAAKVDQWGSYAPFHRTNVVGTENVIAAARQAGVPRLVFTSTPSVVHSGGDLAGIDESVPYPDHFEAAYPQTKAAAEMSVLAANDAVLSTVALRPRLIWGPEDTNLVPQLIAATVRIWSIPCTSTMRSTPISWPRTGSNRGPPAPVVPISSPTENRGR
jgi:nucleoside-diphosphate-sugar epimerase